MKVHELLDRARSVGGLPSDRKLALACGVLPQIVSDWRHGRRRPTMLKIYTLAELAGMDIGLVLAQLEADRAEEAGKESAARAWREIVDRIGGIAAAVVFGAVVIGPGSAEPSNDGASGPVSSRSIHRRG